ncbi:AraC family transcriptional regulator ligand-binding domain-containing protein [Nocardia sp. alder85J]|uniref:AraC family transcriptional regulator ligand-binding domain-containing protein n=1 Tax=Nocardia sp. alder85J TaxID=2862949 RepID=UPI001CD34A69|nr:AraC family transcriptional regulator ligand-binding domain-containing protein [Nocardia sp. alder85J]MCX4097034.1 AraC family transcriptional regulator ligand-binding domain-containing protein [Nocardia sp. alder85J]
MSTDVTLLHRFVIGELAAAGVDRGALLRECGIPAWALSGGAVHLASDTFSRLWELAEKRLDEPEVALRVASRYRLRVLGLYDYLFASAATLGAGLATCGPYVGAVTTNHRFDLVPENDTETTLYLQMIDGAGRARDLTQLWGLVAVLTRARGTVAAPLDPIRVRLRQRAPRDRRAYHEVFGTTAVEFEADIDAMTFRATDMTLPQATSDPALARVLQPLAAALPPPPPLTTAWPQRVAVALAAALDDGDASLIAVARRLATSPRTLQRRLADAGTTWRQELERARLTRAGAAGPLSPRRQARLLGYADADTMRRSERRWSLAARTWQADSAE